jgi:8-oxo-dGTP pyrophosphatase MutT (NUDIX family)
MMSGMRSDRTDALERMNRFVARMNEVERDLTAPYVRPKDAATLILVDRSGRMPKVLLGKRHARHKFMPGKFVFPGGRVDPADRHMPVARPLDPGAQANLLKRLARPSPAKARGFALAAIRETFEETGLVLGAPIKKMPAVPKGPWSAFAQANVLPDLGDLHFIGRAITPPGRSRRFDARFFTLDASAIAHRIEGVTGPDAELIELVWMPLTQAKELDMPAVTGVMLEELEARIADGFGHDLPVPFYRMPRGRFMRDLL